MSQTTQTVQKNLQLRPLSSLAKVFPNRIHGRSCRNAVAARGQEISFQVAYKEKLSGRYRQREYEVRVISDLAEYAELFAVGNVPSFLPAFPDRNDSNYISKEPGIFPDPLIPLRANTVEVASEVWRSLWISIKVPEDCPAGIHKIRIAFSGNEEGHVDFSLKVEPHTLPSQQLIFTQWFHCDCIADAHKVPVFSEAHWALMKNYMELAVRHGINMILTPILTPPLDTAIGGERPTVQLVDIEQTEDGYTFGFSRLERYIKMALDCGITYFEISHMFTQWGATMAPKVVAGSWKKGKKIFGWHTDASGEDYAEFLSALVPGVIGTFEKMGIARDRLFFHVSDEPGLKDIESYRRAYSIIKPLISGCRHIDALSPLEFYKEGLVETPVVATNRIEPYLEEKVEPLWCYYCCSQCIDTSNRFFAMPSARTRMIGVQLYKYNMEGFLHWGYNFYFSHHSIRSIDPFGETDAGGAFPSGDAFSVYPFGDRAIPSLRLKVFANALEDMRLLTLLEAKIGRSATVSLLDKIAGAPITFTQYPKDDSFFSELYLAVFDELNK